MRAPALVALLALVAACDDRGASTRDPPVGEQTPDRGAAAEGRTDAQADGPAAADAAATTADAAATTPACPAVPDAATPATLPPCERACDRLVDCATAACDGFAWANAGGLAESCAAACDPNFAATLLDAPDCEATLIAVAGRRPDFAQRCADDPCAGACARLGDCIVERCPAIDATAGQQITADCRSNCDPAGAAWVEQVPTCGGLVDALAANDPNFQRACEGETPGCADAPACQAYAAKVSECLLLHCDGRADPYGEGLTQVLFDYCSQAADCPPRSAVLGIAAPEVGCDHPWLREIGPAPPFDGLCAERVPAAEVLEACSAVVACPGTEGLGSPEICAVYVAIRPDAEAVTACVRAAADCAAVYPCLEGP